MNKSWKLKWISQQSGILIHLIFYWLIPVLAMILNSSMSQCRTSNFNVLAFYTARNDPAHISFVHEANRWFTEMASGHNFTYDSTQNWDNLNETYLSGYQVIVFLDTRPEEPLQRAAFRQYMENGGAWMGFHFAAFALTPSDFNQDWDWYHETFLGSGSYVSNTWKPTPAILRVEHPEHPAVAGLPEVFTSSPNEWYRWENDLRDNASIEILISIDHESFPLGTGPKLSEIWLEGDYPVVWTNKNFRMIYINMGHNRIDYAHNPDRELSHTFNNPDQDRLILDGLMWLGGQCNR